MSLQNASCQLLLLNGHVQLAPLPLQAAEQFMFWLARTYPGRLYDQGVSGPSAVVAWRHVPYAPSKTVVDCSDTGCWLMSVQPTGLWVIFREWLLYRTRFHGPSNSIGGVPRQTHRWPRVATCLALEIHD